MKLILHPKSSASSSKPRKPAEQLTSGAKGGKPSSQNPAAKFVSTAVSKTVPSQMG